MKEELSDLPGKTAVITGGGKGLGRAMAIALARVGVRVAICGRTTASLEATVGEVRSLGAEGHYFVCDVSVPDEVKRLATRVSERLGEIDVLINNAAWAPSIEFRTMTEDTFIGVARTNVLGTLYCCRVFGEDMVRRKKGSIINISSIGGIGVSYGDSAYNASKAALIHFTRGLAQEWASTGVRANALCPGFFPTDLNREAWESDPDLWNRLVARVPLGRPGADRDLDGAIRFLASDESAYVTGTEIVVDGGHLTALRT